MARKYVDTPSLVGGTQRRVSSPPGLSTLITSAPRSPSSIVQYGPARTREKSATSRPASGPGRAACPEPAAATARGQAAAGRAPGGGMSGRGITGNRSYCPLAGQLSGKVQCGCRSDPVARLASRQGQALRGIGLRDGDLGRRLAGGPVSADGPGGLQQQRQVLPRQHLDRGFGGGRVHVP